jgi:hypothetical protein
MNSLHSVQLVAEADCTVEDVIRNRLVQLLKPYVEGEMRAFEREFTLCAAAISGSTALWMLLIPDNWTPKDLNIIAPSQGADKLVQFFESIGYTSRPTSPDIRQSTCGKWAVCTAGTSPLCVSNL